jgi:uncharacterized protein YjbI with pentapeptide repeats
VLVNVRGAIPEPHATELGGNTLWDTFLSVSPEVVAAIIAASVSFLTLVGSLLLQFYGIRRTGRDTEKTIEASNAQLTARLADQREQLNRTLAEQRERTLNERFATAADRLGTDKPSAVRLAAVYAMASLADDWEENRQTCVDVLCAYLRMPYAPDPGEKAPEPERRAFGASREVRHTVIRVITEHLKHDAAKSWQALNLDFTGVVFDGGDFSDAVFAGRRVSFFGARFSGGQVSFVGARFSGFVRFDRAEFSGGAVGFADAAFVGHVGFEDATFSGAAVFFDRAEFSGGQVSYERARFSGGFVGFTESRFSGGMVSFADAGFSGGQVGFLGAEVSGGTVVFGDARFSGGKVGFLGTRFSDGRVSFVGARFSGGTVIFGGTAFSGGTVDFDRAEFSGGTVDFGDARFSGGKVSFVGATFSGGTVDLSSAGNWSSPPKFPWTGTAPPGVKLPKKEEPSPA